MKKKIFLGSEKDKYIKLKSQPSNLKKGELKEYQLEGLNWLIKFHSIQ